MTTKLLQGGVRLYQLTLSPIFGGACRFQPSCSQYALEALEVHGARKGTVLAMKRLAKCHPMGPVGYDPVPGLDEGGPGDAR